MTHFYVVPIEGTCMNSMHHRQRKMLRPELARVRRTGCWRRLLPSAGSRLLRAFGMLLAFNLLLQSAAFAQESPADREPDIEAQRSREAAKVAAAEAQKYGFSRDQGEPVELRPQPLLKWSNPAAGSIHGNVFLWTLGGRPYVAGSLFQWYSPFTHQSHEFVSLAPDPFVASYEGSSVWRTDQPGVTRVPLPQAPSPADTARSRLLQMRALFRQFSATKVDREGDQQELRPLPQPVYRYTATDAELIDGGLFVFVQGTDPEVWLILEARQRGGARHWEFAAAPMNSVAFTLRRNSAQVWHVGIRSWGEVQSHRETYTSFRFGDLAR